MASTRNLRHGTLIIRDGTGTPNTLTIPIMDGDLSFNVKRPQFIVKNRGQIDHRRSGDQEAMDVRFSFKFEQWSYSSGAATGISVVDALSKTGGAASWLSVDPNCGPFAVDLLFRIADPCNANSYEQLIFPNFSAEDIGFKEGDAANMIDISGKSLAVTPTRSFSV